MSFKLASAYVELSERGFSGVSSKITGIGGAFRGLGGTIGSVTKLLPGVGTLLAGLGAGAGVGGLLKLASDAESTAVSMGVMLGSTEKAKAKIAELQDFATKTPFSFSGLSDSYKTMLSFSIGADEAMTSLEALSNIAAGDEGKLRSLSLAFSQIASAGKLAGQDLMQLINAGFNPLQVLSEQAGQSMATLRKKMEAGGISFDMVKQAITAATSEGGRFYQMNEKQSQTLGGLFSTLKDSIVGPLTSIGTGMVEAFNLKAGLAGLIGGVEQIGGFITSTVQMIAPALASVWEGFGSGAGIMTTVIAAMEKLRDGVLMPIVTNLLPAMVEWYGAVGRAVSTLWERMAGGADILGFIGSAAGTVIDVLVDGFDAAIFAVDNFGLLAQIAFERAKLGVSNLWERIKTWGGNVVEIAKWAFDNWKDIAFTVVDAITTFFINLGENVRMIWSEVVDYVKSFGDDPIEINTKSMLDGFRSSISKMPELTEAAVQETTASLDGLMSDLEKRAVDQGFGTRFQSVGAFAAAASAALEGPVPGVGVGGGGGGGGGAGTSQGARSIDLGLTSVQKKAIMLQSGGRGTDPVADNTRETVRLLQQQNQTLQKQNEHLQQILWESQRQTADLNETPDTFSF